MFYFAPNQILLQIWTLNEHSGRRMTRWRRWQRLEARYEYFNNVFDCDWTRWIVLFDTVDNGCRTLINEYGKRIIITILIFEFGSNFVFAKAKLDHGRYWIETTVCVGDQLIDAIRCSSNVQLSRARLASTRWKLRIADCDNEEHKDDGDHDSRRIFETKRQEWVIRA